MLSESLCSLSIFPRIFRRHCESFSLLCLLHCNHNQLSTLQKISRGCREMFAFAADWKHFSSESAFAVWRGNVLWEDPIRVKAINAPRLFWFNSHELCSRRFSSARVTFQRAAVANWITNPLARGWNEIKFPAHLCHSAARQLSKHWSCSNQTAVELRVWGN